MKLRVHEHMRRRAREVLLGMTLILIIEHFTLIPVKKLKSINKGRVTSRVLIDILSIQVDTVRLFTHATLVLVALAIC